MPRPCSSDLPAAAAQGNENGVDLFVLDPFQPHTYAVHVLQVENWGDLTTRLADLCLADLDHDGLQRLAHRWVAPAPNSAATQKAGAASPQESGPGQ